MAVVVQKYGGSSVANIERLRLVAGRIAETRGAGHSVVVVVSAMGDTTDQLLKLAYQVSAAPRSRELDLLLSVGERISMTLLAMAINDLGLEAISFTGSQSGIITDSRHTNARIVEVRADRIVAELQRGKVVIVAGYQGVSREKDVTTLGRGGSDTTAIALAAALGAERCEIHSDVDGVYTADPRIVLDARRLEEVSYEEMLAMARAGAVVLKADAVEYARHHGITLTLRGTFAQGDGTRVGPGAPERGSGILAVAGAGDQVLLVLPGVGRSETGRVHEVAESVGAQVTEILWTGVPPAPSLLLALCGAEDPHALPALERGLGGLGPAASVRPCATVSIVGAQARWPATARGRASEALEVAGISPIASFCRESSIVFVIPPESLGRALALLHGALGLSEKGGRDAA